MSALLRQQTCASAGPARTATPPRSAVAAAAAAAARNGRLRCLWGCGIESPHADPPSRCDIVPVLVTKASRVVSVKHIGILHASRWQSA